MPDARHLPLQNKASDAFNDPTDPLVKSYHYRAHLLDCIYDMIEESPGFTDAERLSITNKLLEHQYELDSSSQYSIPNGDRHVLWHMLCIYTGSRYFSHYYPDQIWSRRLDNVRKGFQSFIGNPTWGVRDTLEWISTAIEPVFEFFLLDGSYEFVHGGTARTFMKGLEVLMSGEEIDDYNRNLPFNLLYKAAWLLNDSRYIWMADQLRVDFPAFRIGQSYWPPYGKSIAPPNDLVGKITVAPLAKTDWKAAGASILNEKAFQLLSYRSGLEKADDYLLLDGFEGLGRHPYQLNTLLRLRMFGGKNILAGYGNDLFIWHDGVASEDVARSAALKNSLALDGFAYIQTEVTDMPSSRWQRHIVYLKDLGTIVADKVTALERGYFDIVSSWQFASRVNPIKNLSRHVTCGTGGSLVSANTTFKQVSPTMVQAKLSNDLGIDQQITLVNLFFDSARPKTISPLKQGGYLITGTHLAFIGVGANHSTPFSLEADFSYVDKNRVFLVGVRELIIENSVVFRSDNPVTILWDLNDASAVFSAHQVTKIRLATTTGTRNEVVQAGEEIITRLVLKNGLVGKVQEILKTMISDLDDTGQHVESKPKPILNWHPIWQTDLKGTITAIAAARNNNIWAVTQTKQTSTFSCIAIDGTILKTFERPGEVLSVWPAKGKNQSSAFDLLAGFKDDWLVAFSKEGEEIWRIKASIHPSFIIGDHYDAPWFTDPRPPHNRTGIYSILADDLWNTGREEIAIGRPCTVEFRNLKGELNARVPTRWGNNTVLSILHGQEAIGSRSLLLVGKGYTGNPQLSGIRGDYTNASDSLFYRITPGHLDMHAWLQRGMSELRVADINGDGDEEVIYTLSGHWNELRVYDGGKNKIRWMRYFGPDKSNGHFMRGLEIIDFNRDGKKEVIVGMENGWLCAFDHTGKPLWQRHFGEAISCLGGIESRGKLAVGLNNGSVMILEGDGTLLLQTSLPSSIRRLLPAETYIFAGDENGTIEKLLIN